MKLSWIQSLERQWAVISGQQEMFSPALCSYCPPQPREHSCKMKTPWVIFPSQWMRAAPMTACKREIASWKKKIFQRSACCAQLNCDDPLSLTVLFFGGGLFVALWGAVPEGMASMEKGSPSGELGSTLGKRHRCPIRFTLKAQILRVLRTIVSFGNVLSERNRNFTNSSRC